MARVSVCPQALEALREQSQAFVWETGHALQGKARWQGPESDQEAAEKRQASLKVRPREWLTNELCAYPSLSTCLYTFSIALEMRRLGRVTAEFFMF